MTEQLNVQQMAQRLMTADNILILCHKNPDGDTIGCGSALYCALKALDKNVAVLCSDAIPNRYAFTNAHMFKGEFEPQTVVAVDVASVQLFGENNGMTQFSRHVDLCIDHHAGNSGYADFTLLDGSAAAAAELLYEVINAMGVAITPHIADCLYTGLATDTGCFRFSSTTANTHIVAAKLIEAGCHVEELNTLLFDTKPRERLSISLLCQAVQFFNCMCVHACTPLKSYHKLNHNNFTTLNASSQALCRSFCSYHFLTVHASGYESPSV